MIITLIEEVKIVACRKAFLEKRVSERNFLLTFQIQTG